MARSRFDAGPGLARAVDEVAAQGLNRRLRRLVLVALRPRWRRGCTRSLPAASAPSRWLRRRHDETHRSLAERRAVLDSAERTAAFAEEMSEFLRTSDLAESKAFIRSVVKQIAVQPRTAMIRYTIRPHATVR